MKFSKLKTDDLVYKTNRLLTVNDSVYSTEHDGKTLIYWVHGSGLIPLHKDKSLIVEHEIRHILKAQLNELRSQRL